MALTKIDNYAQQTKELLIQQFKDNFKIEAVLATNSSESQELENTFFDLLTYRNLETATGTNLDRLGAILNEPRFGLSDANYRITLYAKIARNVSEGTPEDLIRVYSLLVQSDKVIYAEGYPAAVYLTALNPDFGLSGDAGILTVYNPYFAFFGDNALNALGFGLVDDPNAGGYFPILAPNTIADIGDLSRIKAAVEGAKPAGVAIVILSIQQKPYFVFDGDPDPDGAGFASLDVPNSGGRFAIIL